MAQGDWVEESPAQERTRRRWIGLGLGAAVVFFLLMVSLIHVSTFEVETSVRVMAQPVWVIGERNALRAVVLHQGTGRHLGGLRGRAFLHKIVEEADRSSDAEKIFVGEAADHGTAAIELGVVLDKKLEAGRYTLELEISGRPPEAPSLDLHEQASFELSLIRGDDSAAAADSAEASPPPAPEREESKDTRPEKTKQSKVFAQLRHGCEEGRVRDAKGEWSRSGRCGSLERTRLYPEGGSLVSNLNNRVYLWSNADSGPFLYRLRAPPALGGLPLPKTEHPFLPVERDAAGVAVLSIRPSFPPQVVEISEAGHERWLWLRDKPTQILARTTRSMQRADEAFEAEVFSGRNELPLFLDLWVGGRWLSADSVQMEGSRELRYALKLPETARGLAALRVSYAPDGAQGSFDETLFFLNDRAETAQGLRRLVALLKTLPLAPPEGPVDSERGEDGAQAQLPRDPILEEVLELEPRQLALLDREGLDRLAAIMLSRVELTLPFAPMALDNFEAKSERLDAWKVSARRPLIAAMALIIFATLFLIGQGLIRARRALRARLLALDIDDEQESPAGGPALGKISASGGGLAAALLVGLILFALFAIAVLMETLKWHRGL